MKSRILHLALLILLAGMAVMLATAQTNSQSKSTSQSSSGSGRAQAQGSASSSGHASGQGFGSGSGGTVIGMRSPTHAIAYVPGSQHRSITATGKERVLKAQAEYLQRLAQEGKVVVHGPWRDEPGALTILSVRTDQEAREIAANDPAVLVNFYEADLRGWNVTILGSGRAVTIGR